MDEKKEEKIVSTLQEIPSLFIGKKISASETVRQSLEIARQNQLIPEKSPLRTIWYAFVKLSLQSILNPPKGGESIFYRTLAKYIRDERLYYRDFNIENSGVVFKTRQSKGFGNSIICLEKESYFGVFQNFSNLLGISIYAAGGQPSQSGTEYVFRQLPDTRFLQIFTISDFDPAGIDIANTIRTQFEMYSSRIGNGLKSRRIGTNPEYYTDNELSIALYEVKGENKARWNKPEVKEMRDNRNIPDNKGLEVESLPADPEPIFDKLFPNHSMPSSWSGQARIRLITLKWLLDVYGIEGYLEDHLRKSFENERTAEDVIYKKSGKTKVEELIYEIKDKLNEIDDSIEDFLKPEKKKLEKELNWWSLNEISRKISDKEYKHEFLQNLIESVARDDSSLIREYFEIPDEIKDNATIPDEKMKKIKMISEKLEKILEEITTLFNE